MYVAEGANVFVSIGRIIRRIFQKLAGELYAIVVHNLFQRSF